MSHNIKTKFTAFFLSLLLVICVMPITTTIAEEPYLTLSVASKDVSKNSSVTVELSLEKNLGIVGLAVELSYDASKLEITSSSPVDFDSDAIITCSETYENNPYYISWVYGTSKSNIDFTGKIADITFKTLDTCSFNDELDIKANIVEAWKLEGVNYAWAEVENTSVVDGKLTVVCNHSGATETVTKPATCSEKGIKHIECGECGYEDDVEIPIDASAHTFEEWNQAVPATCTDNGVKGYKHCSSCNKNFDANGVEITDLTLTKTGHAYGNWTQLNATKHQRICANNPSHIETQDHSFVGDTCSACGYNRTHVHTFGQWVNEISATCTENGVKGHKICSGCQKNFDESGAEIDDLTIPAGHTFEGWIDEKPASCTEDGVKGHKICSVCKKNFDYDGVEIENLTIPAGHKFGKWIDEIPADYENNGVKGHKDCSVCFKHFDADGNEITDLTIQKLTPEFTPGDVDNTGSVNLNDVTRLAQYVAKWNVTVVVAALDPDGSGSVNLNDVTLLAQKVARWDVTLSDKPYVPKK